MDAPAYDTQQCERRLTFNERQEIARKRFRDAREVRPCVTMAMNLASTILHLGPQEARGRFFREDLSEAICSF